MAKLNIKKNDKIKMKFKKKGVKKNFRNTKIKFDVNARLIVRNLSFKTNEETIKNHFEPFGKVLEINLLRRKNGDLVGCGFIQYEFIEHAKAALNTRNGQPFLGRSLQIDWATSKNEFVSQKQNLKKLNDEELNPQFKIKVEDNLEQKKYTECENEKKNKLHKNNHMENKVKNEEKLRIKRKARLIIRNISFKATKVELEKHFGKYGEVLETVLLKKSNGELVGCGFVQFKNTLTAAKAMLETNAKPFLGREIFVDWAVPKNKYMSYITQKEDELEHLKADVKSEPESSDNEANESKNSNIEIKEEYKSDESDNSDDDMSNTMDVDCDAESYSENESDIENPSKIKEDENKRISANDAEDGLTVFLKNIPFSVTNDDLEIFANGFGDIHYALICVDKLTEHSKGTGFIRFKSKEDADICLSASPEKLTLQGQVLQPLPALFRDRANKKGVSKKEPKDSRNLYLIKEGVILANTKAAEGVSTSDMSKRMALEQRKSEMLKNLNRFISRYRLTIHNVPLHYKDEDLKKICLEMANVKSYALKECRIMRNLKGPFDEKGNPISKGYAFVTFTKHEDAITCLRRMNNNPSIFDKNNRPIASFSIEDKAVINARIKRLEKSKIKNPINKLTEGGKNDKLNESYRNKLTVTKNKKKNTKDSKGTAKIIKNIEKRKNNLPKKENIESGYVGEIGTPGKPLKMRSRYKLKMQVDMHKENMKQEKKQQKRINKLKKVGISEKIKQEKQKMNSGQRRKMKKIVEQKNEKSFTDLVNKYKSKLVANTGEIKIKSKWYE